MRLTFLFLFIFHHLLCFATDSIPQQSSIVDIHQKQNRPQKIIIRCGTITTACEPLYVINGELADALKLSNIHPNDIKAISILRANEATAIYGSKGASGVVVIETNKLKRPSLSIIDAEDGSALEGASVQVVFGKDTLGFTSSQGLVELSRLKLNRRYQVKVSFVGYNTLDTTIFLKKLDQVRLSLTKNYKQCKGIVITSSTTCRCNRCGSFVCTSRCGGMVVQRSTNDMKAIPSSGFAKIYPNPAKRCSFINIENQFENECMIELLSSTGQLIKKDWLRNEIKLKLPEVAASFYFIRVTDTKTKATYTTKLLIN